jgi:hypothetical protein
MWYRVLDRFGLPTLFVLLLCFAIGWTVRFALNEWTKHDAAVASAMLKQAEKTEDVAKEVHAMASDTHTQLSVMLDRLPRVLVTQQPAKPVPMQSPVNRLPQPLFLKATTK